VLWVGKQFKNCAALFAKVVTEERCALVTYQRSHPRRRAAGGVVGNVYRLDGGQPTRADDGLDAWAQIYLAPNRPAPPEAIDGYQRYTAVVEQQDLQIATRDV
jgi:hypothetical protein